MIEGKKRRLVFFNYMYLTYTKSTVKLSSAIGVTQHAPYS